MAAKISGNIIGFPARTGSERDFKKYDEKTPQPDGQPHDPTRRTYGELTQAYDFFNERLFHGELPPVIITLTRRKSCLGYFAGGEFKHSRTKQSTDEIAMNAIYMAIRSDEKTLSTIVHEMCHVWQYHFSKYPKRRYKRRAYHDKEWGGQMEELGLIPSDTAKPGGRKTGNRVSHYIAQGGRFQTSCRELIADGFTFTWREHLSDEQKQRLSRRKRRSAPDLTKVKFYCPTCLSTCRANYNRKFNCGRPKCTNQPLVRVLKSEVES